MGEWKKVRIGDFLTFQNGFAFKSKDFKKNGKYKIIRIKELKNGVVKFFEDTATIDIDINKDNEKFIINNGDVLFALTGDPVNKNNPLSWVGRVSLYNHNETALLNQRVCKLITNININSNYVYYYFRVYENFYNLASKATGSASQANISVKTIEDELITLPNIITQNKIVSILKSLDDKIELNNKINNNLEKQAKAIFKSWFVDFEPFGGVIPSDWKIGKLGDICDCLLGGTPSRAKPEYWNGNIAWINSGEINRFRITSPSEYITKEGLNRSATKLLPAKTTVLAITGATLGQVSLLEIDSCANQSVVGIVPNEKMPYEFIYPFIKSKINEIISHQTGGAQQHINKQNIESIEILIPNDELLKEYIDVISPIYAIISNNCFEINSLVQLRDTLLPKLINGEIDVSNIQL